jgi:hypothetical protein
VPVMKEEPSQARYSAASAISAVFRAPNGMQSGRLIGNAFRVGGVAQYSSQARVDVSGKYN